MASAARISLHPRWLAAGVVLSAAVAWGWTQTPTGETSEPADLVASLGVSLVPVPVGVLLAWAVARTRGRGALAEVAAWTGACVFGCLVAAVVYVAWFWSGRLWCEGCAAGTTIGSRVAGCGVGTGVLALCAWTEKVAATRRLGGGRASLR